MDRRIASLLPAAVVAASAFIFGGAVPGVSAVAPASAAVAIAPSHVVPGRRSGAYAVPRDFTPRAGLSPADRGVAADVPRFHNDVRDLGPILARKPIEIGLLMRSQHETQLEQLTLLQSDPKSPMYHHYLSSAQFNAYFAPTQATYVKAMGILAARGFKITGTYANRGFLRATAPAATVERYFATQLHSVLQDQHGARYANVTPAAMPAELRPLVVSLSGFHTTVTVRHPMHFVDRAAVLSSAEYAVARASAMGEHRNGIHPRLQPRPRVQPHPLNVPTPLAAATPKANPSPDPGITPGTPTTEYLGSIGGYGPDVYVNAYDYPVEHGYGGRNHAAGSVIEADFLNSDMNLEFANFGIPRTGKPYRECWDATDGGPSCYGTIGAADPEGESTLDALTIMSMAPASDFYEYLAPQFDDIAIEGAYELALNQNVVDAVNSSFGGCETDDPTFGYSTNYIAMEGAALGISFEASTGDTGATNCGVYAANGAPQSEINTSLPSSDDYFTAVGGTDFYPLLSCTGVGSDCYTMETGWTFGGGGYSVFNPVPTWQAPSLKGQPITSVGSQTMRNTPDVVFTADELPPGAGIAIYYNAADSAIGGTSVAAPMWTALQVEINQVQHSRNGFVNPGLYAVQQNPTLLKFAFRDITGGLNLRYLAIPGYDDSTGIGSPLGWELAAVENGTPGNATPLPVPTTSPTPAAPTPTPTAKPTPVSSITPHPVGANYVVTTIGGNGKAASVDGKGKLAEFDAPTGIAYATTQGTDPVIFINDFTTGFLRDLDLTTGQAATLNNTTWNNATREKGMLNASNLFGLGVGGPPNQTGLYVAASGDSKLIYLSLPTTLNASTANSVTKAEAGQSTVAFDTLGNIFDTSATTTDLYSITSAVAVTATFASATTLPAGGNNGLTVDGSVPQGLVFSSAKSNSLGKATELPMGSTISSFVSGAPLNGPEEITEIGGAFYVANCGGNNIVKVTAAGVMSVVAGDGAPREHDGDNTGAEFDCPFGIATDGTNLYVTDFGGNTIRKISNL